MIRIIDGTAYLGNTSKRVSVTAHDLGNGHLEVSGVRQMDWQELDWTPVMIQDHLDMVAEYREENAEEIKEAYLRKSANRAKTRVRRLCKVMGADTLLTLTYRTNMTDLAKCKANLKEFVRRLRRVLPDFHAVASFEPQERGAWHVHMATIRIPSSLSHGTAAKVKSFNVIRAIWRSVTKEDGGTANVARSKATRSAAKIAAYIAKYISKAFLEGEAGSNRWTKFGDAKLPIPLRFGSVTDMADVVRMAFELVDASSTVAALALSRWDDWFFLVVENGPPKK